jgi:hypothetical protein
MGLTEYRPDIYDMEQAAVHARQRAGQLQDQRVQGLTLGVLNVLAEINCGQDTPIGQTPGRLDHPHRARAFAHKVHGGTAEQALCEATPAFGRQEFHHASPVPPAAPSTHHLRHKLPADGFIIAMKGDRQYSIISPTPIGKHDESE